MKLSFSRIGRSLITTGAGLLLLSAGSGLVSCAGSTDPAAFGQKAQTEVKKGMTKDQVREILGSPLATTSNNGQENWHYQKNNSLKALVPLGLGGTERTFVIVSFNASGRVTNVNNRGVTNRFGTY